jgi:lysophospholipase L1-like esterase
LTKDLAATPYPRDERVINDNAPRGFRMKDGIPRLRTAGMLFVAFVALSAANPGRAQPSADAPDRDGHWVGTWASAPQLTEPNNMPPPPGLADATLRQIVHVSIGGNQLRVQFSNAFGTAPLTITSAHVARAAGDSAIRPDSDRALTFHGKSSVTIPPGAPIVSDPVRFELAALSNLAVTIHVKDPTHTVTGHPGSRTTSYLQAGDAVSAAELPTAAQTPHWYYLSGVDVLTTEAAAVATLGDSITDGRGSTTDGNDRWPDQLARRLQANTGTAAFGVLNLGIGGNCVLYGGLGPNALARLDRDVLAQPGVRWIIVLEGINDLGTRSARAEDLIAAYEQIILRAHARDIRVYGATILPCGGSFYFRPDLEADRQAINTWIRTSGQFDAVIDFDAATRDPQKPSNLSAAADGGDHLHPGVAGYKIMADAIDLKLFAK